MSDYSALLKDVRWQKKRLEILERDKFTCQGCWDCEESATNAGETLTLHVHHMYYIRGKKPWEYPDELLITLCSECHEEETEDGGSNSSDLIKILKSKRCLSFDFNKLAMAFINIQHTPNMPFQCHIDAACEVIANDLYRYLIESIYIYKNFNKAREILDIIEANTPKREESSVDI